MQSQLVSAHGMLAILEVLESRTGRDVTLKLLQIVNAVSADPIASYDTSKWLRHDVACHHRHGLLGELLSHWVCSYSILL